MRAKEHYTQQNEEGELETEEDDRKKRSEWRGRPVKWLHWSLSETPMVRDHFPPLFSLASSYPNPRILPTPYSSLRVSSILSKRDSKEKRGKNGCIHVINFRPSTQASRRHHPGRIDRHLLLSSIENMRGREGTIRKSRETIFNRENYRIAWLPSFLFSWIPTNVCTELQSIFAYSSRFSHAAYYGL